MADDNSEEYEGTGKVKDSDIYRNEAGIQIGRVFDSGSKDIENDPICLREYERSVNMLEVALCPFTGYTPWDKEKLESGSYTDVIKLIRKTQSESKHHPFDLKAMALMKELPKLGLVPPKSASDKDIGKTEDYREWVKHRKGDNVFESTEDESV